MYASIPRQADPDDVFRRRVCQTLARLSSRTTVPGHAATHEAGGTDLVNHDDLSGFVANEHVDHSTVSITGGDGCGGGGTIASNRTITNTDKGSTARTAHEVAYDHTKLHDAATVGGAPLTIAGQQITFNYDANDFQLSGNNLQVKDGGVAHDSTSGVHQNVNTAASPTFAGLTLSGMTATRLLATNGDKAAASVANLATWIAGTSDQIVVTDDTDGTITLSTPQSIATTSAPQFARLGIAAAANANHQLFVNPGAHAYSQMLLQYNSTGGFSLLAYAADNNCMGFDTAFQNNQWICMDTSIAWLYKTHDLFCFMGSDGNTVGNAGTQTSYLNIVLNGGDTIIGPASNFALPDSRLEIECGSTYGKQALTIDQNDTDQPFIDFQGTSAADVSSSVTTDVDQWTFAGLTRQEVNGSTVWVPHYTSGGSGDLTPAGNRWRYVDRGDPSAWDWAVSGLTTDGTWRDLDCSSIVPAGAVAIHFKIQIEDDAVARQFGLRKNGNANAHNKVSAMTQVANVTIESEGMVCCDSGRVVEYQATNATWTTINLLIRGWWIPA